MNTTLRTKPTSPALEPLSSALLAWLKSPAAYPERPSRVECRETHISWVFLGDRYVYKLKKPVRFDFLDFSTLALRRQACEAEVRLNRRLAREVYLDVVPITQEGQGRFALGGNGPAIDFLVKMRRLPANRMLDAMILANRLTPNDVRSLAAHLGEFYRSASPLTLRALEYRRAIQRHVLANRRELLMPDHALPADLVKRAHAAQTRFLQLEAAQVEARVCDGRIVDGHGDLRPEHICLESEPAIFDCIEFSDEFRRIDVVDELSFLAMECDMLGAAPVGEAILNDYRAQSRDRASDALVHFYKAYRACVRAKVSALTADQATAESREASLNRARAYLRLADACAMRLGPPTVVLVTGLMGSGKSTLATRLVESTGAEVLQTDQIRRASIGPSSEPAGFNQAAYSLENREQVYDDLLATAERLMDQGLSVVLDGTFLAARYRSRVVDAARRRSAEPLVIRCSCPDEVAMERIANRSASGQGLSEARPDLLRLQQAEFEPDPPGLPVLTIDSTAPLQEQESVVLERLREMLARSTESNRSRRL